MSKNVVNEDLAKTKRLLGFGTNETSRVISISPYTAQRILNECNPNNRSISNFTVEKYAKRMQSGTWMLDSSAIAFNSKGQLVNGQHRLSAVVKANKPIKFLVAFNIENHPEMDRGRARHISDNIKTDESLPDSIRESRDIQLVATSICRVMQKSYGIETEAVRNLLIKYGDKFQELDEAGILRISGGSRYRVVSAGMFAAYINGVDIDTLLRVKEVLIDGCCRDDSDKPIIGLRDKLLNQKGSGLALEVERFNYTTYCIWSVIKGHTSKKTSCKEPMYKVEIK